MIDSTLTPGNLSFSGYRTDDGFEVRTWRLGVSKGGGWAYEIRTDAGIVENGRAKHASDVSMMILAFLDAHAEQHAAPAPTREQHCVRPLRDWCDCDWCRLNNHWHAA